MHSPLLKKALPGALFLILLSQLSFSTTTCTISGCDITITLNIAVSGANQSSIDKMKNEIENVWNGAGRTTGDCKCPVTFKVNAVPISALNKSNCTPPAPGYHCVTVTPWNGSDASLPSYTWPNGSTSYYVGYMGRTQPSPPQNGASTDGWWSDQMSRPVPGGAAGENYKDFAHEAGHMMGLADGSGGLMNFTSGPNSGPTQQNIDQAVENACGKNACPDRCCCGNGQVDSSKGEGCDPKANPTGCAAGASCCPVCCSCYTPMCDASKGNYQNQGSCEQGCTGGKCYFNYKTGCWDCVKQVVVITPSCYEKSTAIEGGCGHSILHEIQRVVDFYNSRLSGMPFFSGFFANERINVYLGNESFGVVVENGTVSGTSLEPLADPSMNIFIAAGALEEVEAGGLSIPGAMAQGKIRIEGVGWFNSIKAEIAKFLVNTFAGEERGSTGSWITETVAGKPWKR